MRDWRKVNEGMLKVSDSLLAEFLRDYKLRFGEMCPSCKNKLPLYLKKLINYKKMTEKTCVMKPNAKIYYRPHQTHYFEFNITDEIALEMLELNPKYAKFFIVLPAQGKKAPAVEKPIVDNPVEKAVDKIAEEILSATAVYEKELVSLAGIGKKTVEKIVAVSSNKVDLSKALDAGTLELTEDQINTLREFING
ncbi:unnamed protein product [marine sediment metagenome]|uniref:Uncharacterized protein n=1 Tax=marine sediment metagenome TaxID=412755 RepID=X0T5U0_9ZZZZ